jgi:SpoVK/Ycf46/Vps4 family AAA+-type ATPase
MNDLLSALERLDVLIAQAISRAQASFGNGFAADPFRGLHISLDDAQRLLERSPGQPLLSVDATGEPPEACRWLVPWFGLRPFDIDVVLIALAPELDLRYERLYAYLQDDVTCKRPTVELMLNLLTATVGEKIAARSHFAETSPLIRGRVVRLVPPPDQAAPPLLSHFVKLDEQIVDAITGSAQLDARLAPFCQLHSPTTRLDDLLISGDARDVLNRTTRRREAAVPIRLHLYGLPGTGRDEVAGAIAAEHELPLLAADLGRLRRDERLADRLVVLFREARLTGALLHLERIDALVDDEPGAVDDALVRELITHPGPVVTSGSSPWRVGPRADGEPPVGMVELRLDIPDVAIRRTVWDSELSLRGIRLGEPALDELAGRFRMTSGQIAEAAQVTAALDASPGQRLDRALEAARAQTRLELGKLAVKSNPVDCNWADLVVPDDVTAQLREIRSWVANRERVLGDWGFNRKLSRGKGPATLFAGPPGTGKTMAVEIIARDLGLDLYTIDLSAIVSKWIGETEKNLDRVFQAAEHGNAVLCFDEADALFGKRSEVSDAHDRYANIEISYLLQKLETYQGLAVLTTNMLENVDEAFIRRLAFKVHFPFPEVAERRAIWERIWPPETPREDDVDLDALAAGYRLSGGNIKNVALASAYVAAAEGSAVAMRHALHAVRRELAKIGRAVSEGEFAQEVVA